MKKSLLLIVMVLFISSNYYLSAQEMVSTDPQPRNVVLEEFTGIHCVYCPDGHRRAAELAKNNPGRVFLINIHAGSYARPNAGELDLRTTEGTQIDGAAGVSGYPAGSVNRSTSPWAMGRGEWAGVAASQILPNTSPVNVAVKSEVDFDARELTTTVEWYYTSDSPQSENYLTVVLTQSGILGTQTGGANYNPDNMVGDLYSHNHALRMVISEGGAFGEKITETTSGTFGTKTYTTVLPDNIMDIDVILINLEVVAFVHESRSNVYSGHGAKVDYDKSKVLDLALENLTVQPEGYCFTSIHPIIEVTNLGKDVDGFDVTAILDGTEYTKTFDGVLAQDETTTIDWGEIDYSPTGSYTIEIKGFSNISGGAEADMISSNDSDILSGLGFTENAFGTFNAGFDSDVMPQHVGFDQSQNEKFQLYPRSAAYGANGSFAGILFFLHESWGLNGKPGYIVFGEADLSSVENPAVGLFYAYAVGGFNGTPPTVKVEVSEDCGDTWVEVGSESLTENASSFDERYLYTPNPNDWDKLNFSLEDYAGKSVLIRVVGIPGSNGNSFYLDEISVEGLTSVDAEVTSNDLVYPNPVEFDLTINNKAYVGMNYTIYSLLGEVVAEGIYTNDKINVSNLSAGSYMININNNMIRFIKK